MSKFSIFFGSCLLAAPLMAQTGPQAFVDFAAQTDMTEAHLGQLAQDNAQSQAVKDYGQTLTTDHTSDYKQLSGVATKAGLTVPKGIDAKHWAMIAPLEKMKGAAFDHRFEQMMVSGHTAAIAQYKKEESSGENADIKSYAQTAMPTLEKHLEDAKGLGKKHKK